MSTYPMPPDTSAKEKVVGGVLDIPQLIFILAGLAIGLVFGFILKGFMGMFGLVFSLIIGLGVGVIFAFVKIKGLGLFQYLREKKKHKRKTKKLPNVRKDGLSEQDYYNIRNF